VFTVGRPFRRVFALSLMLAGLVPATGRASTAVSPRLRAEHTALGTAVPLIGAAPAWFDAALYRRVVAAGPRGVPLRDVDLAAQTRASGSCLGSSGAAPTSSSVPTTPNGVERQPVGLGPGTLLISLFCSNILGAPVPTGFAICTANFVFQNGSSFGLGTAGHCAASDALASPVTAIVVPPPEVCANGGSCAPGLYAIGTFTTVHNGGLGDDFAMISLYPAFNSWVRPTMPVFGGPTGTYGGGLAGVAGGPNEVAGSTAITPSYFPAAIGHCGHGLVIGTGGTCRVSHGLFASGTWYAWYGPSTPGDSGSGVEILGDYSAPLNAIPAVANLTHIIIADVVISRRGDVTAYPDEPGMIAGTQISKILSMIGSWQLVTGLP